MSGSEVLVSYNQCRDTLDIYQASIKGYFTPNEDEHVLKCLVVDGEVMS